MEEVMMPYEDVCGPVPLHQLSQRMHIEAEAVVSMQAPYRIQHVSQGFTDLLGFSAAEVTGRSLGVVSGPNTDAMKLNSLLKCAALGMANKVVVAFYSRSGRSMLMRVSCTPVGLSEATITFSPSDAVPAKMAMQEDDCLPKVILSATAPHIVQSVSPSFIELYGIYGPQIVGRSLHLIHGPRTDMRVWNAMVKGALEGQTQCDSLYTCASDCTEFVVDATITPAFSQDDRITHLVCLFSVPPSIPINNLAYANAGQQLQQQQHQLQQQQQQQQHMGYGREYTMVNTPDTYPRSNNRYGVEPSIAYHHDDMDMGSAPPPSVISARLDEVKVYHHHSQQHQQHLLPEPHQQHLLPEQHQQPHRRHSYQQHQPQQHGVHPVEDFGPPTTRPVSMMAPPEHPALVGQQYPLMMTVPEHRQMSAPVSSVALPPWSREADLKVPPYGAGMAGMPVVGMESVPEMQDLTLRDNPWGRQQQAGEALTSDESELGGDGTYSAIFPRRKGGQGGRKSWQGPVLITLEVLESMSDVALSEAAKKLGVSSTAIKKACRKLGVQRWPYRKQAEGAQQTDLLSHYNEAYVRKLFRKYSPKVSKAKGSPSASSPSDSITTTPDSADSKPATPALSTGVTEEDGGGGARPAVAVAVVAGEQAVSWLGPQEQEAGMDPTHPSAWLPAGSAGLVSEFGGGDAPWMGCL